MKLIIWKLLLYDIQNLPNFYNLYQIRKTLDNKLCSKFKQNGGFFYDQNDDFILQVLDLENGKKIFW